MYRMYCENYTELPPVSLHMYRKIFNTEFNLSFHVPKKDRCDYCEECRTNISPSEEDVKKTVTMRSQKLKQKMSDTVIDTSRISRMLLFVLIWKTLYVCLELTLTVFFSDANCLSATLLLTALSTTVHVVLYGVKAHATDAVTIYS